MDNRPIAGAIIPVTAFQASAYRTPAEAMAAYRQAFRELEAAEARYAPLRERAAQLRGAARERWEFECDDYWDALIEWGDAKDALAAVERGMGIFHPAHRDRLEAFIEGAISLLDFADGDPDAEENDPDLEDDDPDSGVEDYPFDPEEDRCLAGDDGCGPVAVMGAIHWGPNHEAEGDHSHGRPRYGIDQSKGPLPSDCR